MTNRLRQIEAQGQSIWIDNLSRELLDEGELRDLIERGRDHGGHLQPEHIREGHGPLGPLRRCDPRSVAEDTSDPHEIFRGWPADVRDAADLLKPTFDGTQGADGYVSFELPASSPTKRRDRSRPRKVPRAISGPT